MSRSARLLSNGTWKSCRYRNVSCCSLASLSTRLRALLCLLDGLLALYEKTDHPLRPGLSILFMDCSQLSNMMSVAQRVRAVVLHVRLPVVMNRVAFQSRQNPDMI